MHAGAPGRPGGGITAGGLNHQGTEKPAKTKKRGKGAGAQNRSGFVNEKWFVNGCPPMSHGGERQTGPKPAEEGLIIKKVGGGIAALPGWGNGETGGEQLGA